MLVWWRPIRGFRDLPPPSLSTSWSLNYAVVGSVANLSLTSFDFQTVRAFLHSFVSSSSVSLRHCKKAFRTIADFLNVHVHRHTLQMGKFLWCYAAFKDNNFSITGKANLRMHCNKLSEFSCVIKIFVQILFGIQCSGKRTQYMCESISKPTLTRGTWCMLQYTHFTFIQSC